MQSDAVMTIDTDWFQQRITDRQMSQRGLAKLMGIDPGALSLTLRGKRKMTLEEAAQIAVLLDVSTQEILERAGIHVQSERKVKIVGYINDQLHVVFDSTGLHEMIDAPPGMPPSSAAIQMRAPFGQLSNMDGFLFFVSETHTPPAQALGNLVVAAVKGNGTVIATITKGYKRGTFNLIDYFGHTQQNLEIAWVMPVHWIKTVA